MKSKLFSILISLCLIFVSFGVSFAQDGSSNLTWDAPTVNEDGTALTDLAGYKVYYGTVSRSYTNSVDVGSVQSHTLNLVAGTYYFAVTAYDTSGNESVYSNEQSGFIPIPPDTTAPDAPVLHEVSISLIPTSTGTKVIVEGISELDLK